MHWERAAQPCCHSDRSDQTLTAARRVTVSHVVESRAMQLWVGMKAAVLMAVAIHRTKLIQVLRSAVRAHPVHAASDASAQTFCSQSCVYLFSRTAWSHKVALYRCTHGTAVSATVCCGLCGSQPVSSLSPREKVHARLRVVRCPVLNKSVRVESHSQPHVCNTPKMNCGTGP